MAFLRIAVFDIEEAPHDALEVWDDLVGAALRNDPGCTQVLVARQANRYALVSTWISEDRFRLSTEAKPFQDVLATVAARLGMPARPEPSFVFEGEV